MPRKIHGIIIGGSGLVGGAITYHFHNKCDYCEVKAPNTKKLNLRNAIDIRNYFKNTKVDFIVNTAIASLGYDAEGIYEINYLGTINLARVALALDIPYIHMSSAAVLDKGENVGELKRTALTSDLCDYTKSKLMCELTLEHLHREFGLNYTAIRLGIVYGKHDYKIQGFHRLLFAIAARTMPVLLTRKGVFHSYTNLKKIPHFVEYLVANRTEYNGKTINFVDRDGVELSSLIMTIRNYLGLRRPHEMHLPLRAARVFLYIVDNLQKIIAKVGVETTMPPELAFLENLYENQTLNTSILAESSFKDPFENETLLSYLPTIIEYYLKRWRQLGLLQSANHTLTDNYKKHIEHFAIDPAQLVEDIHSGTFTPYESFEDLSKGES
jgi:nucleoside-diphosphate-sugar epimerase